MTQNLELAIHTFPGERPALLIHGLTRSAQLDWIEPGWPSAPAAHGRGTIAVDLPGHGSCPRADPGAVARGDAKAPDPVIEELATWVSLPGLTGTRRCCSSRR